MGQSRCELVGSMSPAAIDDPHDLCVDFAEGSHHSIEKLAPLLSIKVEHNFIEEFRDAIPLAVFPLSYLYTVCTGLSARMFSWPQSTTLRNFSDPIKI